MSFLILILLVFTPCLAYGANDVSKYNTIEQDALIKKLNSDAELIKNFEIQKIRDFIYNEDPDFINDISKLAESEQSSMMREWLAKKSFGYFYMKYMNDLKTQSNKTGRAIKTEIYSVYDGIGEERHYWLDRGVDEKECYDDSNMRRACDYPDGFEEYYITHTIVRIGNNYNEMLMITKDDVSADTSVFLDITLHASFVDGPWGKTSNVSINATGNTEKYTDRQRFRNQEAADIRAGKYRKTTGEEQKRFNTGTRRLRSVMDDSREWKSNNLFPDAAVTMLDIDYSNGYTHTETK